jgi:hypothetical protein
VLGVVHSGFGLKRGILGGMMNTILGNSRKLLFALALLWGALASSAAHAVLIEISDTSSFAPGIGYGIGSDDTLDVRFTATLANQSFSLNAVDESLTFDFGSVQFAEPNSGGGIGASETDNLGVMANIVFTSPLGGTEVVSAVGEAVLGAVSDAAVDYTLTWSPLLVNFGIGGQLQISLATLSFAGNETQTQTVTITLLALPEDVTVAVSEPATLAIFGFGLLALGALVRRHRT